MNVVVHRLVEMFHDDIDLRSNGQPMSCALLCMHQLLSDANFLQKIHFHICKNTTRMHKLSYSSIQYSRRSIISLPIINHFVPLSTHTSNFFCFVIMKDRHHIRLVHRTNTFDLFASIHHTIFLCGTTTRS